MRPATELRAAAARLRCEHSFPVYLVGDSFASPGPCSACGVPKGDLSPVADQLREPLAALLDQLSVVAGRAQEGSKIYAVEFALVIARQINGTPTP